MKIKDKKKVGNMVYNFDSRDILNVLGNSVKIKSTITSPPYFDMKDYGSENQVGFGQSYQDYLEDLKNIFSELLKLTFIPNRFS